MRTAAAVSLAARKHFPKEVGYSVTGNVIFHDGKEVARSYRKHQLYAHLKSQGVDYKELVSKKLLPDEAIYVLSNNTLFVLELKYQETPGSVDEKIQTYDFKVKQYRKLMKPLGIAVEFIYILGDWFKEPPYKDALDYIESMGGRYFFGQMPLSVMGLPD
jgi:hypothetical protein